MEFKIKYKMNIEENVETNEGTAYKKSRVLFLRNLPKFMRNSDIENLCNHFGFVSDILIIHQKRQAFVQFEVNLYSTKFIYSHYFVVP